MKKNNLQKKETNQKHNFLKKKKKKMTSSFGQPDLQSHELLSVGVGNVYDLGMMDSLKFCALVNIPTSTLDTLNVLHEKMNKYLVSLTPQDFIKNVDRLPHDRTMIFDTIDATLTEQTIALKNFNLILKDLQYQITHMKQNISFDVKNLITDIVNLIKQYVK